MHAGALMAPVPQAGPEILGNVLDLLLDAVLVVDGDDRIAFISAACEQIFGYTPAEMTGRVLFDFIHPEDRAATLDTAADVRAGNPRTHFVNRYLRKDGSVVHVMWSARWSESDQARIAVARDVTALKRAETMQAALYAISDAASTSEDLPALCRQVHGIVQTLMPARNCFVALHDGTGQLSFPYFVDQHASAPPPCPLDPGTLTGHVIRTGQALLLGSGSQAPPGIGPDGHWGPAPLGWLGVPLATPDGVIGALVVKRYSGEDCYTAQDETLLQFVSAQVATAIERKQAEVRLRYAAGHDLLTELPNRALFNDRLDVAVAEARRDGSSLSLLYIDLDGFKDINDVHGHGMGDSVLRTVAGRISACVRGSDTVSRIGGDEFAVLLRQVADPHDALAHAERIRTSLLQPMIIGDHELRISASVGVASYPGTAGDQDQLLRQGDEAMYVSKRRGGNHVAMAGPN